MKNIAIGLCISVIVLIGAPFAVRLAELATQDEALRERSGAVDAERDFKQKRSESFASLSPSLRAMLLFGGVAIPLIGIVWCYVLLQRPSFGGDKKLVLADRPKPEMTRSQTIAARIDAMFGRRSDNTGPFY